MMIEDGIKLPSEPWCSILQGQVGISIHCNLQNASNGQEEKTSLSDWLSCPTDENIWYATHGKTKLRQSNDPPSHHSQLKRGYNLQTPCNPYTQLPDYYDFNDIENEKKSLPVKMDWWWSQINAFKDECFRWGILLPALRY